MNNVSNIEQEPVTVGKTKMTDAERQANRQRKLKSAYLQSQRLQEDLTRANIILNTCISGLAVVISRNSENTAIEIIMNQLSEVSRIINPSLLVGLNRRSDDKENEQENVENK